MLRRHIWVPQERRCHRRDNLGKANSLGLATRATILRLRIPFEGFQGLQGCTWGLGPNLPYPCHPLPHAFKLDSPIGLNMPLLCFSPLTKLQRLSQPRPRGHRRGMRYYTTIPTNQRSGCNVTSHIWPVQPFTIRHPSWGYEGHTPPCGVPCPHGVGLPTLFQNCAARNFSCRIMYVYLCLSSLNR